MRAAFDTFWNDPHTVRLAGLRDVAHDMLAGGIRARAYTMHTYRSPARVAALSQHADDGEFIRSEFAGKTLRIGRIDYFADAPGKPAQRQPFGVHESTHQLQALLRAAQDEIVLQTPYLVLSSSARKLFAELHARK